MPFTLEQQKDNRLALARHLSRNVKDSAYNHSTFDTCALGRAAKAGIAGMYFLQSYPCVDVDSETLSGAEAAEHVFGQHCYDSIFASWSDHDRKSVIKALREFVEADHG